MKRAWVVLAVAGLLALAGLMALDHEYDAGGESERAQLGVGDTSTPERAPPQPSTQEKKRAHFGELAASPDVRRVADWVVHTGDHGTLPFLIIDKRAASLHVFDSSGRTDAATPVLLGVAPGDRFAPGAAEKDMHETRPSERITPSGRFLTQPGLDDKGHHVVWIQYDAGISLHAVLDKEGERRQQRLATPTPDDNRISFGCINLPSDFYRSVVRPLTERTRAVVYVLPDSEDAVEFFTRVKVSEDAAASARDKGRVAAR